MPVPRTAMVVPPESSAAVMRRAVDAEGQTGDDREPGRCELTREKLGDIDGVRRRAARADDGQAGSARAARDRRG